MKSTRMMLIVLAATGQCITTALAADVFLLKASLQAVAQSTASTGDPVAAKVAVKETTLINFAIGAPPGAPVSRELVLALAHTCGESQRIIVFNVVDHGAVATVATIELQDAPVISGSSKTQWIADADVATSGSLRGGTLTFSEAHKLDASQCPAGGTATCVGTMTVSVYDPSTGSNVTIPLLITKGKLTVGSSSLGTIPD